MSALEHGQRGSRRWRRAIAASSVVCSLVVGGIVMLPTVLHQTNYRNRVLNEAFSKYGLTGSSASASGGWIVPVGLQKIEISDADGRVKVTIDEVRTTKSLLGLFSSAEDLGEVTLVNPVVEIALDDEGRLPLARPDALPSGHTVAFRIENGSLRLSVPWRRLPIVDISELGLSGAIEQREGERWLRLDPVQVFDHEPLAEAHTEQNLALIAPVLSQTTRVTGEASVWLDGVEMPIGGDTDLTVIPLSGHAEFYHVEARLKQAWATQISQLFRRPNGSRIPDRLEIVRDSAVRFQFTEHGIHHDGLAILLPDVAERLQVNSSGVVGFDEKLDLTLAVLMPGLPVGNSPLLQALAGMLAAPLELQVVGTVSEPRLVPPADGTLLDQISKRMTAPGESPDPPPVAQAVLELIQAGSNPDSQEASGDLPGSILGLIRAVKHEQQQQRERPPKKPAPARRPRRRAAK
ncbi:MAG: DUF4179 domain-containing protein [Planctomycetaceae bacterium]